MPPARYIGIPDESSTHFLFFLMADLADVARDDKDPRRGTSDPKSSPVGHDSHRTPERERSHLMATTMFTSLRKYTGAPALADELVKHQAEIEAVLRPLPGFQSYTLLKASDAVISLTVCDARAGAEESNRVEATWLKDKLSSFSTRPPEITIGEVRIHFADKGVPVAR